MPGMTIGWEYLTGRCVATDSASRQRAEWPPHPGRVFMALAATWFETGEDAAEGEALRWLERLGDPELMVPSNDDVSHREVVTVFVPVNDNAGPSAALLQSAPSFTRSKQPRTFPSVWVGDSPCFLHWPNASDSDLDTHRPALSRLCGKVTRIGHSSSLVTMWLADEDTSTGKAVVWVPDDRRAVIQARRAPEGTLDLLERVFNRRGREEFEQLEREVTKLTEARKAIRGRGAYEQKSAIDGQVEAIRDRMTAIDHSAPIRPTLGLWSGYRPRVSEHPTRTHKCNYDCDMLILVQVDGPRLPLVSTLAVTQALRGTVMSQSGVQPSPSWVSGHLDDGQPLRDGRQHLAFLPLPFVGSAHASGHILGLALVFPKAIPRQDRGQVLGNVVLDPSGQPKQIKLTLGSLGVWTIVKRHWSESRQALTPETWTALPYGAMKWATVTPVVLDRFPKNDPIKERIDWHAEVARIVRTACERVGLPDPIEIEFGTTSWHRGSPRSIVKRRPLRGHSSRKDQTGSFGDGFPNYSMKGSNGPKPQFHVFLRFAEPVIGPILLGAGRFMGYGLCKPLWEGRRQ